MQVISWSITLENFNKLKMKVDSTAGMVLKSPKEMDIKCEEKKCSHLLSTVMITISD